MCTSYYLALLLALGGTLNALKSQAALPSAKISEVQQGSSTQVPDRSLYSLPVKVDEVELRFSATDKAGQPKDNLRVSDLRLRDNGKKPLRVLAFEPRRDLSIRAGILIDTSRSARGDLYPSQQTASDFVSHILKKSSDKAFVMQFDFEPSVKQNWTGSRKALNAAIGNVAQDSSSRMGGTAIFDAIYIACHEEFDKDASTLNPASNTILLFSDGLDNVSHAQLQDDIYACQQTHTVIYIFSSTSKHSQESGLQVLRELASQSGGRIFYDPGGKGQLSNLQLMEEDLRSDYIIVYRPEHLKTDGSYHRIHLSCPHLHVHIKTQTGYYAYP